MLVLNERNKVCVIINFYNEYLLSFVLFLVGMLKYVQQETLLNIKDNIFE